jgi:hypothetical protein
MKLTMHYTVSGKTKNVFYVFIVLLWAIVFGLRPDSVGSDTISYKFFFEKNEFNFELGFSLLIWLLKPLGWSFFKFVYALLTCILIVYNLARLNLHLAIIFILPITAFFYQFEVNTIRSVSSLVFLLWLIRADHPSFLKQISYCIIACFFHLSALLVLLLWLIYNTSNFYIKYFAALIGISALLYFKNFQGFITIVEKIGIIDGEKLSLMSVFAEKVYKTGFRIEFFIPVFFFLFISNSIEKLKSIFLLSLFSLIFMLLPSMDRYFIFIWIIALFEFLLNNNFDWKVQVLLLLILIPGVIF